MMRSRRNRARMGDLTCPCDTCTRRTPSRTFRTREKAALARSLRRGEA